MKSNTVYICIGSDSSGKYFVNSFEEYDDALKFMRNGITNVCKYGYYEEGALEKALEDIEEECVATLEDCKFEIIESHLNSENLYGEHTVARMKENAR